MFDPILIVGAGPVGLAVAVGLARHGHEVAVFDARPGIPPDVRATTLQPPALECMDEWGVLDRILQQGRRVDRLAYWDLARRELLAELDYRSIADATPHPYRVHLNQAGICRVLLDALEGMKPGAVRWSTRITELVDHGDRVSATAVGPQGPTTFSGGLLVGADGAHSSVRQSLGIELERESSTVPFHASLVSLDAVPALAARLGRDVAPVSYLYLRQHWVMWMQMADAVRLLVRAPSATTPLDKQALAGLAAELFGPDAPKIRGLGLYGVRQWIARRFRVGRVVLAGDAAHAAFPVGGTAMNAGLVDAGALVRAILADSDEALDAYEAFRREWIQSQLLTPASEMLRAMATPWPWSRLTRANQVRSLAADPERAREHLLKLSMLGG